MTHKFNIPIRENTSGELEQSMSEEDDEEESEHNVNNYKINKSFKDIKHNPSNASEYRP
jgi:hypothetical protein